VFGLNNDTNNTSNSESKSPNKSATSLEGNNPQRQTNVTTTTTTTPTSVSPSKSTTERGTTTPTSAQIKRITPRKEILSTTNSESILDKLTIKVKKNDYVVWIKLTQIQIELYAKFITIPEIKEVIFIFLHFFFVSFKLPSTDETLILLICFRF
jgi:hypothetical protein